MEEFQELCENQGRHCSTPEETQYVGVNESLKDLDLDTAHLQDPNSQTLLSCEDRGRVNPEDEAELKNSDPDPPEEHQQEDKLSPPTDLKREESEPSLKDHQQSLNLAEHQDKYQVHQLEHLISDQSRDQDQELAQCQDQEQPVQLVQVHQKHEDQVKPECQDQEKTEHPDQTEDLYKGQPEDQDKDQVQHLKHISSDQNQNQDQDLTQCQDQDQTAHQEHGQEENQEQDQVQHQGLGQLDYQDQEQPEHQDQDQLKNQGQEQPEHPELNMLETQGQEQPEHRVQDPGHQDNKQPESQDQGQTEHLDQEQPRHQDNKQPEGQDQGQTEHLDREQTRHQDNKQPEGQDQGQTEHQDQEQFEHQDQKEHKDQDQVQHLDHGTLEHQNHEQREHQDQDKPEHQDKDEGPAKYQDHDLDLDQSFTDLNQYKSKDQDLQVTVKEPGGGDLAQDQHKDEDQPDHVKYIPSEQNQVQDQDQAQPEHVEYIPSEQNLDQEHDQAQPEHVEYITTEQNQDQDQHKIVEYIPSEQNQGHEQDQDQPKHQDEDQSKHINQNQKKNTHQDQDQNQNQDQDLNKDQDQDQDQDKDQDPQSAVEESGGSVPALVITQVEECQRSPPAAGPAESRSEPPDPLRAHTPADQVSCCSDGGDQSCCDRLSLRSDSISLASERTLSRTSEEDDRASVTASSVMSLFQRVQLDPLEREWLKSSALGNMAAQSRLLAQEPNLVTKKDFITTALHWAAKQGRQEAVDMMLRSGADVNVRSGYTALHLASIHGHQHVVQVLINTYKAKTSLRDYHGKTAVHYWSGCSNIFTKHDPHSGGHFSRGRWTHRYALPSFRLPRSRSQGQISVDFTPLQQSTSLDTFEIQL